MAENEDFMKALASDFSDEEITENPTNTPPADEPKKDDPATPPTPPASDDKVEEPKKDDPENPADPNKKDEELEIPPADPAKPKEDDPAAPKDPETPPAPTEDEPKPLTEEGILRLINQSKLDEQNETKVLQETFGEVMKAYYPDGLSNVLVDQTTGKELRTPQDVVDASGGDMSMEQAAQWLLNKQFELDQSIQDIRKQAAQVTETTVNFKRDTLAAVQKYDALFKAYPDLKLQEKTFDLMMQQVQADVEKGVIIKAPDVMNLYDTYLEPYWKAFEFSQQNPGGAPTPAPAAPTPPAPATPTINDRLDEGGDGGESPVDDPTNFAQQVTKELAGGF